jgi:hypothetical protein
MISASEQTLGNFGLPQHHRAWSETRIHGERYGEIGKESPEKSLAGAANTRPQHADLEIGPRGTGGR